MTIIKGIVAALNILFAIALVITMVTRITEEEQGGGGGGWGIVGGRQILTTHSGGATILDRFVGVIAAGFLVTSLLLAWLY
ncbi:MAG: hypothetical protein NZ959_03005 [Armatimonadetes bacterium]|nr:hypothetical protein [Armatimonadota bacterium]MDW8121580.1 hypothetical protein [Armatimonadota bacterium]